VSLFSGKNKLKYFITLFMYKFNYIFKLIFNWYIANILKVVKLN